MDIFHNSAFLTMAGGMGLWSVLYSLKEVPARLWALIKRFFTVSVTIDDRVVINWLQIWLDKQDFIKDKNLLRVLSTFRKEEGWVISLGIGTHFAWFNNRPLFFSVSEPPKEKTVAIWEPADKYKYIVWTIGRSQKILREFIDTFCQHRKNVDKLEIFGRNKEYWEMISVQPKRKLETVFLNKSQKEQVIHDAEWFFRNERWYNDRGIPYRRGYLFQGPPGTGKTSLVTALASHLGCGVYLLNLSSIENDDVLLALFNDLPNKSILLLEDIDAFLVTHSRVTTDKEGNKETKSGITLSGLLNALDGVANSNGRITIITTNYPDKLDPALTRPGRIDLVNSFSTLDADLAAQMFEVFYPNSKEFKSKIAASPLKTPAEWQSMFLTYKDNLTALSQKL